MTSKYEIRLDRGRHFGVVTPPESGAHFYQDGFYFTHAGDLVEDMLDDATTKKMAKMQARAEASRRQEEIYRQELANQGLDEKEIDEALDEAKAPGAVVEDDASKIDLIAWAKGQRKIIWAQVRKAFRDQHSRDVDSKQTALEFLIEEGFVAADDVAA